ILGNSTIAGNLTLASYNGGQTVTQVAGTAVNMTGNGVTATFNGFTNGVTLANSANVLGAIAISNVGPLSIQENAPITQASVWSNGNSITLATTNDQAITLNQ